jgi:hypothetical protein
MSMNIRQLMDKIVDGNLDSSAIVEIGEALENEEELTIDALKAMYEDLSTLRYHQTIEVLLKSTVAYLVRPKRDNAGCIKDYKRALHILKFIIREAEDLHEAENREDLE